jgi:hypothetical protein
VAIAKPSPGTHIDPFARLLTSLPTVIDPGQVSIPLLISVGAFKERRDAQFGYPAARNWIFFIGHLFSALYDYDYFISRP